MKKQPTLAYFGHPKSAGTWWSGFFLALCHRLALDYHYKQIILIDDNLDTLAQNNEIDFFISQNSSYEKAIEIEMMRGVHVIRDPRDMTVSGYFSYKNSHPLDDWIELAELRQRLLSLDIREGMKEIIDFNLADIQRLKNWNYADERIIEIKLEDFMVNPFETIREVVDFLGLLNEKTSYSDALYYPTSVMNRAIKKLGLGRGIEIPAFSHSQLKSLYENQKFSKMSKGRKPGQESKHSHFRKGVSGDWKNYFDEDIKAYFLDSYGEVLQELGYETDNDW